MGRAAHQRALEVWANGEHVATSPRLPPFTCPELTHEDILAALA